MKKLIFTAFTLTIILAACKTKQPVTEVKPEVKIKKECTSLPTYVVDIKPIMEKHCTRCHGQAGGYNLSNWEDVNRAAKNGSLLGTIKWHPGYPKMPAMAVQLDSATIARIECWVDNGSKQ